MPRGTAAGATRTVEVTHCVKHFNSTAVSLLLYRPFRHAAAANAAPVPADDLSGGNTVSFYSAETTTGGNVKPVLGVYV